MAFGVLVYGSIDEIIDLVNLIPIGSDESKSFVS